ASSSLPARAAGPPAPSFPPRRSSDLPAAELRWHRAPLDAGDEGGSRRLVCGPAAQLAAVRAPAGGDREAGVRGSRELLRRSRLRSEEQRLNSSHLVISYAVFCLKKKI